jgi:parallel beta-helix repeat protein
MGEKKATLILLLALCFMSVCFPDFQIVEGNPSSIILPEPAFIIRSDGSVDPSTAPIHRDGDLYTFTDNIVGYTIRIERDNITLDGGGYTLRGNITLDGGGYTLRGYGDPVGIYVMNRQGVTVRNTKISGFAYGIQLFSFLGASSNNRLENNVVTDNYYGVYIAYSQFNVLRNNRMKNNIRNLCVFDHVQVSPEVPNIYINDIDSSNTVDDKPIIYWIDKQGETVPFDAGYVALINCTNMTAQNLDLAHNGQGILLISTTNSLITKNHISHSDSGIYFYKASNLVITENNLESNDICIDARRSSDNSISLNNMRQNENGICFVAGPSQNNVISGNSITNTGNGIYLGGLINTTIEQNTIAENNGTGVFLLEAYKNRIIANSITSNGLYGIQLWENSTENTISKNSIANNKIGILIEDSTKNSIIENIITNNNSSGLQLKGSQNNNVIYHNNFIHNQEEGEPQVSIPSENSPFRMKTEEGGNMWDNGTAGNYWSDYAGTDADGDGVGDTPYTISANNIDHYPLMASFEVDNSTTALPTPEPSSEQLPTTLVIASTILIVAASSGLIVYFRKHKQYTTPTSPKF